MKWSEVKSSQACLLKWAALVAITHTNLLKTHFFDLISPERQYL